MADSHAMQELYGVRQETEQLLGKYPSKVYSGILPTNIYTISQGPVFPPPSTVTISKSAYWTMLFLSPEAIFPGILL